jgi:hypothetical protein
MPNKTKSPTTKKVATVRGLTYAEYRRIERRVNLGELTWEQAEQLGLCLPKQTSGRKRKQLGTPKKKK